MDYVLFSSAESQLDILAIAVPGQTDRGQYGSNRGIPCYSFALFENIETRVWRVRDICT